MSDLTSVTDACPVADYPDPSRNDEKLRALEDTIRNASRGDPDRERRRRVADAQRHGLSCAICGRSFSTDETLFRKRVGIGANFFGHYVAWVAPVCADHVSTISRGLAGRPCVHCGRDVVDLEPRGRVRARVTCCEVCENGARVQERREARALNESTCEQCAQPYMPTRRDARYCSNACRQAAYRNRVTDARRQPVYPDTTRNGQRADDA